MYSLSLKIHIDVSAVAVGYWLAKTMQMARKSGSNMVIEEKSSLEAA